VFLPDVVVRSRRVVRPGGTQPAAIHVRNGRIVGVLDFEDVPTDCPLDDAGEDVILPGLVDSHVHVNEPDGFDVTTRAAASGGVTTLVDMPLHSVPVTTTVAALEAKRESAGGHCFVDVGFWGGVVPGNARSLASLYEAGVLGFKCILVDAGVEEFRAVSEHDLRLVMPALARIGATLLVHAEWPGPIHDALTHRSAGQRWIERIPGLSDRSRYSTYLESRPKAAENEAVAMLIQLCREYRTKTHILHLSSSDALTPIFHARTAHLPLTVETCPHYLCLTAEEIPNGATAFKVAPPIRDRANREFLWAALAGGLIQTVVSAHSPPRPATTHARSAAFATAWDGIGSIQLGLSIMWTGASARGYSLDQVARWMCLAPARVAGLSRKGAIDVGYDADLVVLDPDAAFTVEADGLYPRPISTPYSGHRLRGVVRRTYLRGRRIYERGKPFPPPTGQLLARP